MARRACMLGAVLLVALSGASAQNATVSSPSAASAASAASPVSSWAIFDPTAYAGYTTALQAQFAALQSNFGAQVSSVVSGLPTGILNLGTEASQLLADLPPGAPISSTNQVAILTDSLRQTTCSPPAYVPPTKVPTQCVGAKFTYTISGGYCVIQGQDGPVTCKKPTITLKTDSSFCNLKFTTPTQIKDVQCQFVKTFGSAKTGTISSGKPTTYTIAELVGAATAPGAESGSDGAAASAATDGSGGGGGKPTSKPKGKPSKPSKPTSSLRRA